MKRIIFTLLAIGTFGWASAQQCGAGVAGNCVPSGTLATPGFQDWNTVDCIVRGVEGGTSIEFKNFTDFNSPVGPVTITRMRFDSIENLPCGLCWKTKGTLGNTDDNIFDADEDGCIYIYGNTNDVAGQYKLRIKLSADLGVGFLPQVDAEVGNIRMYVRVKDAGGACPDVDTSAASQTVNPANCPVGIKDDLSAVNALQIVPNPITSVAEVSFVSSANGTFTTRLMDITGKEVARQEIEVTVGKNETTIQRNSLPAGVYFYTISDGTTTITRKVNISE